MREEDRLREQRLIFYREDIEKIDAVLEEFLEASGAKCALLVDKEGHMVTRRGNTSSFDLDTISALVAGSFAATREMARLLGEVEFSVLFHQGKRDNIQLCLVGDKSLMTVIFDEKTTLGMVRLYANEAVVRLAEIFRKRDGKPSGGQPREAISSTFSASAKDRLKDVFG